MKLAMIIATNQLITALAMLITQIVIIGCIIRAYTGDIMDFI